MYHCQTFVEKRFVLLGSPDKDHDTQGKMRKTKKRSDHDQAGELN